MTIFHHAIHLRHSGFSFGKYARIKNKSHCTAFKSQVKQVMGTRRAYLQRSDHCVTFPLRLHLHTAASLLGFVVKITAAERYHHTPHPRCCFLQDSWVWSHDQWNPPPSSVWDFLWSAVSGIARKLCRDTAFIDPVVVCVCVCVLRWQRPFTPCPEKIIFYPYRGGIY